MGDVNVPGLISIIIFYLIILLLGLYAARKKRNEEDQTTEIILAGRSIGAFIGIFTMTATWVGGGFLNGTAESVYASGLVWAQAPWGYSVSLFMGGLLFAKKMREANYVTMLDPLQITYGRHMGAILYIPALLGDCFWSAAILSALGGTLSVILSINMTLSVIISACIAAGYTVFGGLYSVAYTDVLQLICMFIGLWLTVPFALMHEHVTSIHETKSTWLGELKGESWGLWMDYAFLLIFGGIPWQVYFQRVLSSTTARNAQYLSFAAALGCFLMSIPPVVLGAVAKSCDWPKTSINPDLLTAAGNLKDTRLTLPIVLQYLTPGWVSFIGLGAVSAAVMSSADSSALSASCMFAHNIYKKIIRKNASTREVIWVIRVGVIFAAFFATLIGLTVDSINALFYLCADLVYVLLFPHLLCAIYVPFANVYGAVIAFIVGLLLRLSGGEKLIGLDHWVEYPMYSDDTQHFPFRSMSMAVCLLLLISISFITSRLLETGVWPEKYDFFNVLERRRKNDVKEAGIQVDTLKMEKVAHKENEGYHVNA